jgi:hypothetical protein
MSIFHRTGHHVRVVSTRVLYYGGPWFKYQPDTSYPEGFYGLSQSIQVNKGIVP